MFSNEILDSSEIKAEKEHIRKLQEIITTNPDKCVFGKKNILKAIEENSLEYVICNDDVKIDYFNVVNIKYCDYLNGFDGVVGILYYVM